MALQKADTNKISGTFSLPSDHLLHASPAPVKKTDTPLTRPLCIFPSCSVCSVTAIITEAFAPAQNPNLESTYKYNIYVMISYSQ